MSNLKIFLFFLGLLYTKSGLGADLKLSLVSIAAEEKGRVLVGLRTLSEKIHRKLSSVSEEEELTQDIQKIKKR